MNQAQQFANELDKLVERFAQEWDLEYAQVIGVLMMKAHLIMSDAEKRKGEL
jgi:hypothetical protein